MFSDAGSEVREFFVEEVTLYACRWEEVRSNADNLRLIQFGLALSNEAGKPPPGCGVWQSTG